MKKRLLKFLMVILGVMIFLSFNNVQATEIISVFTGEKINRKSVQTIEKTQRISSINITISRKESVYTYNSDKTVWSFYDKNNENDKYYCLNEQQGFNSDAEEAEYNFATELTLENLKTYTTTSPEKENWTQDKFNQLLWVLDHMYVSDASFEDINKDPDFIALLKNAKINIEEEPTYSSYNLTKEDVIATQRLVIWHFTNNMNIMDSLGGVSNEDLDNYLTGQVTAYSRKSKMKKLYQYFIDNASTDYKRAVPSLKVEKDEETIQEDGESYVFGPYTLSGENLEEITSISAKLDKEYTLLDATKNKVDDNNFKKILEAENKKFYIKIPKANIADSSTIKLDLTYKYNERTNTFITNTDKVDETQPMVIVRKEEKEFTLTTTINLVDVQVEKKWNDAENQDGLQPDSIKVQLYVDNQKLGDSVTLNSANSWSYIWHSLLSGKNYTVKELKKSSESEAVEDNTKYDDNYTANYTVEGNKTTITNQYTPKTIEKTVIKNWVDGGNRDRKQPESIEVQLYQQIGDAEATPMDGSDYKVELNAENSWRHIWSNLPEKKDGENITYSVKEVKVPDEYTVTYNADNFDNTDSITITNSYTPEKVNKSVKKEWNDNDNQDGIRPSSVQVQLYKTVGGQKNKVGDEITLQQSNGWKYTWEELDAKENGELIIYTVEEVEVPAGYTERYSTENFNQADEITITNSYTPQKVNKKVRKEWNDFDDQDVIRPESIEVQLYQSINGLEAESMGPEYKAELNVGNNWTTEWNDLPAKEEGNDITYSVKEEVVPEGYEVSYSEEEDTFVITNTHSPLKFDLSLRKFITQVNEQKYDREPKVDTSTIATTGTATYRHTKQPIPVQRGDIVTYTIRVYNEGETDGYVEMITDHLPSHLLPIIDGIEGIDEEEYADEIEFNSNWLWMLTENGITTTITSKLNTDTYSLLTGLDDVEDTKLNAYVEGSETLDYIDVQLKCLVTDEAVTGEYLTNLAEITDAQDMNGTHTDGLDSVLGDENNVDLSNYKDEEANASTENSFVEGHQDDDDFEKLIVKHFDLALRKFITKVNEEEQSREPEVDASKLGTVDESGNTITDAKYTHSKTPLIVEKGDIITYTIRVYNEGTLAGYANEITDTIPEGLEYLPNSSVNLGYRWKMIDSEGNETDEVEEAVKITTDYLSEIDVNNEIAAREENENGITLYYKDVEVQFRVIMTAEKGKSNSIKNVAQISKDSDKDIDSDPTGDEDYEEDKDNEDDIDREYVELQYFDLALRKFITKVNNTEYNNRYPEVEFTEDGEIKYNHTKDPVTVKAEDIIIYTIRVYNEGEKAGYAEEITDNLPEGLEYLPENEINKQYGWKLIDAEGNETEDITKAVKVTTDYLKDQIIEGLIEENGQKILSYKDVQIAFKVEKAEEKGRIIVNTAQISKDSDDDIDSTPDNNDPTEDDEDKEYVKEQYFDLSLKKWVTETRVTYKGKTTVTKTGFTEDSEEMAKVDLVASQMSKTTVKFAYTIKVTNEGEIAGYAEEVKDYIPEGLEFKAEDNPDWKEVKKGEVVTEKLKDTLLNPGESATVEIVLTWKNGTNNTGVKTNYAEISKDSDDDIDSTPDNYNKQEDDIDDAQVILSIKTAATPTYIGLIFTSIIILTGGAYIIKKYVIE